MAPPRPAASHRGGVAADGLSGDGCGVLIHGAQRFLRVLADEAGIALHPGSIAAGNVFLPADDNAAADCRSILQAELARVGVRVAGWREVPVDPAACGRLAQSSMPCSSTPQPSPDRPSAATPPRCAIRDRASSAISTMARDPEPSTWAMRPKPQLSCSLAGS